MNKDSYYLKFINQALEVASAIPKYFSKFSKKIFNNYQKITLLVLRQKLKTTYRDLVELLKITNIPSLIKLKRIPHFTTLIRFSKRLSPLLVRKLITYSCRISKPKKLKLGIDATGLTLLEPSTYYTIRTGKSTIRRKFMQITACVLLDKQLVSSCRIKRLTSIRNTDFLTTVRDSARLGRVEFVSADKGYDAEKHYEYVMNNLGSVLYIPIKKQRKGYKRRGFWRKKAAKLFNEDLYHQRSKIETIFSVIKRKYGSVLGAKSCLTQGRELHQKVLTYNLDRLCKIIDHIILGCHQSLTCGL